MGLGLGFALFCLLRFGVYNKIFGLGFQGSIRLWVKGCNHTGARSRIYVYVLTYILCTYSTPASFRVHIGIWFLFRTRGANPADPQMFNADCLVFQGES